MTGMYNVHGGRGVAETRAKSKHSDHAVSQIKAELDGGLQGGGQDAEKR